MESRKILIAFSMKYKGDWLSIYDALVSKEQLTNEEVEKYNSSCKYKVITILDSEYPDYIKKIYHPPFVLYYDGDINLLTNYQKHLGVVGSRKPDPLYARETEKIVRNLNKNLVIVSGLAAGIDGIAHKAALMSNKKTIAVIGCGLDVVYPYENLSLYKYIRKKGLILSEYPQEVPPNQINFPQRNRIISALSYRLFVPQARERSGSLITVGCAVEEGKEVMCLPSIEFGNSACNVLIKEGAYLVENEKDIEDFYGSSIY